MPTAARFQESQLYGESFTRIPVIHDIAVDATMLWIDPWLQTGAARRFRLVGLSPLSPLVDSPTYPQGCSLAMSLILASASAIRRQLLEHAGIAHRIEASRVDESSIKQGHCGDDAELALLLAEAKALEVSARLSGNWVIGGDSVVSVNGKRFGKPRDREEAERHLLTFSGQTMTLTSAVVLARDGRIDWRLADQAKLTVRDLSERFIHNYLEKEWPTVGGCVGVFRMEGPGIQLFDRIDGDHFTILGMPLLPLVRALRERDLLPS